MHPLLTLFVLGGCPLPPPPIAPAQPLLLPQRSIRLTDPGPQEPDLPARLTQSQVFLIDQRQYNLEGIETITQTEVISGVVRLAVARPVEDPTEPGPLPPDTPATWIVLAPEGSDTAVSLWEQTVLTKTQETGIVQLSMVRPIQEVLTFAQAASTEASLAALLAAKAQWSADHDDQYLWIDILLLEITDAQGKTSIKAYFFSRSSDFPDPPDRRVFFCRFVHRCTNPSTIRQRITCWWYCS